MISLFIQQVENGWTVNVRDDKEPLDSQTQTWICGTKKNVLELLEHVIEKELRRKATESAQILSRM